MEKEKSAKYIINEIINQCNKLNHKKCFNTKISFDFTKSIEVLKETNQILDEQPSVLTIDTKTEYSSQFVIVGDLHGNLESLARIINKYGYPPQTRYLFLGDYVDRGKNSAAVLILLYSLKCLYNDDIFLIRGNHEFKSMTDHYGFKDECNKLSNSKNEFDGKLFYKMAVETFSNLPICAILNDIYFCVHGGISALIDNRDQLFNLKKVGEDLSFEYSVQAEFLWNDPSIDCLQYERSLRGIGCIFGQDALNEFLEKMKFKRVIRGHQSEMEGYNYPFDPDGGILTVFSSLDYCGMMNEAAVAIIDDDDENEKIQTISVLPNSYYVKMRFVLPEDMISIAYLPLSINLEYLPNLILA